MRGRRLSVSERQRGGRLPVLGLYNTKGLLDHVGFTSTIANNERRGADPKASRIAGPPGFTGKAPGGPSRWSTERSGEWEPLQPELVVEVRYDHVTGERFRHGTKLMRFRPDKAPGSAPWIRTPRRPGPMTDDAPLAVGGRKRPGASI